MVIVDMLVPCAMFVCGASLIIAIIMVLNMVEDIHPHQPEAVVVPIGAAIRIQNQNRNPYPQRILLKEELSICSLMRRIIIGIIRNRHVAGV